MLKDYRGLSLVELLVSLSLILILSVISIPSFINLVREHRLKSTAENLFNQLQLARMNAIKKKHIYLCLF